MLQVRPFIFLDMVIVIVFCKQYDYTVHQCALSELRNCTAWRSLYHWSCKYLPGIVGYLHCLITPRASVVHECRTQSHKGTQHPDRSLWHTEYRRVTRGSQGATRINRRTKRGSQASIQECSRTDDLGNNIVQKGTEGQTDAGKRSSPWQREDQTMDTNGVVEYWKIWARDFQSSYQETGLLFVGSSGRTQWLQKRRSIGSLWQRSWRSAEEAI
jgi:hypothetical protein